MFKEGCELFLSEESIFEGRGVEEVIIVVVEIIKLVCF